MHDVCPDAEPTQFVFHNDDDTPRQFVTELMRTVFGQPEKDALAFTSLIEEQGKKQDELARKLGKARRPAEARLAP